MHRFLAGATREYFVRLGLGPPLPRSPVACSIASRASARTRAGRRTRVRPAVIMAGLGNDRREERPMSEKTELRQDLRAEVERIAASDASDEEVLGEAVRLAHDAHPSWDWSGIYLMKGGVLVLGPSTAPADHDRIEVGEGVCGTAVAEDRNQVIEDVREVENYLSCSISTRSEIVVLIRHAGEIVGQFDIDSDTVGAFTAEDETLLGELAAVVAPRVASLAGS